MAIIHSNQTPATTVGQGKALVANISLHGGVMEMLSTVYSHVLLAAIREAVQNACDAVRAQGLALHVGVKIKLPTREDPSIKIVDYGSGMTKEFMEAADGYLSFGVSTKSKDNNASGGLGVGRWAAYGYCRECVVQTTASDMIERSYFLFQGADEMPQVQLAMERAGSHRGTTVSFPVAADDLEEALFAVAWLQRIMQVTLGDAFSVDKPGLLEQFHDHANINWRLPQSSGVVLDLGEVDPALQGVRLHMMKSSHLQYAGRGALQYGALVVLTNQEKGVGGLPFRVAASNTSVFQAGVLVEVPMSAGMSFSPSREEIKYTEGAQRLMQAIEVAGQKAMVSKAAELYAEPSLKSKMLLTQFMDVGADHFAARANNIKGAPGHDVLMAAMGGERWAGRVPLEGFLQLDTKVSICTDASGSLHVAKLSESVSAPCTLLEQTRSGYAPLRLNPVKPPLLVANDLPSGGTTRVRAWLKANGNEGSPVVFIDSPVEGRALLQAQSASERFGNELRVIRTSKLPDAKTRVLTGTGVRVSKNSTIAWLSALSLYTANRMGTSTMTLVGDVPELSGRSDLRIWVTKLGARLGGFKEEVKAASLQNLKFLVGLGSKRLWLLSEKQAQDLEELTQKVKDAGAWDMDEQALAASGVGLTYGELTNLKRWVPLEQAISNALAEPAMQALVQGKSCTRTIKSASLVQAVSLLRTSGKLAQLAGTRLGASLASLIDMETGLALREKEETASGPVLIQCDGILTIARLLQMNADDGEERKRLACDLASLQANSVIDEAKVFKDLCEKYPLLVGLTLSPMNGGSQAYYADLIDAMVHLYA